MRVAIANAAGVLIGPELVKGFEKKLRCIVTVYDSLKPVGTLVNQFGLGWKSTNWEKVAIGGCI